LTKTIDYFIHLMQKKYRLNCFSAALLALFFPLTCVSAEVATLTPVCIGCHGPNGLSVNNTVPIIAGQAFTLIEDNLLAFRDGERACTEFFELQAFAPARQQFDPLLVTEGARIHQEANCETCHSKGGSENNGMSAILAGQWTPYLERSLLRIRAGERKGPKVMNRAIREFSDQDIAALLSYYASQQD